MVNDICDAITSISEKIYEACQSAGRDPKEIQLMAVTKFQPAIAVEEAWNQGLRLFGESRVQDGIEKYSSFHLEDEYQVHLIGSLQRNKAKKAADFYHCIQSVDREPLIEELGALTLGRERPLMILLEYHTGEASKAGFPDLDSLCRAAEKALSFPALKPMGLMTMAPLTSDEKVLRKAFRSCLQAAEELRKRFINNQWPCLSMGMSGDYEIAIEEGSTLVRIGTAIFGERRT